MPAHCAMLRPDMPGIPSEITVGFVLLPLSVVAVVSLVLIRHSRSLWRLVAILMGWTLLTGLLALSGTLAQFTVHSPWIPLLVAVQLLFVLWVTWFSPWSGILAQLPQVALVGLQAFRIPVELLLAMLAARGLLAEEMTYYGRNFDIVAGITAVALALVLWRRGERSLRVLVLSWNALGLSLVTAVLAHGVLSAPYPFQLLHLSVPTFIVAHFPVVWLLSVLVPIAYFLHLLSIRRCLETA